MTDKIKASSAKGYTLGQMNRIHEIYSLLGGLLAYVQILNIKGQSKLSEKCSKLRETLIAREPYFILYVSDKKITEEYKGKVKDFYDLEKEIKEMLKDE